jgi:hypothetical protein
MTHTKILILLLVCLLNLHSYAHNADLLNASLHHWTLNNKTKINASFLIYKNDLVYLEKENSEVVKLPLSAFSASDREFVREHIEKIQQLNSLSISPVKNNIIQGNPINYNILTAALLLIALFSFIYFVAGKNKFKHIFYILIVGVFSVFYSFKIKPLILSNSVTNPLKIDSAFTPFSQNVVTSWDTTYFYVESQGIPLHQMMTGITKWQQQVPIPQCYLDTNAWSIPLNPIISSNPIPVNPAHFSRGAVAIAVNGVPIFNPYTNTGVDAFLDGQLDNWGGHCGRADDYHYHIAPLHLYSLTSNTLPIAYAFDGFAVYGSYEPDGNTMLPLDTNNGHFGNNGVYHYHGISGAPYMIGYMVGEVTEDTSHQIIPQARAHPVRPSLTPLTGASITNCVANGNNGYILTYTLSGQTYQVSYSWTSTGVYTYNFINPGGTTTSTYNGFIPCQMPTTTNNISIDSRPIELFPNPAQSEFSLQLSDGLVLSDIKNVSICAQTGQQILSTDLYKGKIETRVFAKGIYFVFIKINKRTIVKQLVVE